MVLQKTLESPLDYNEIQSFHPKGNQCWIFIGRTDAEAETPILWLPDGKNWLIGKDPDAGKDWRQEEKGMTEDEITWMASPTQWTWVWVNSGSWWWSGGLAVLQSMGSQRAGYGWATELYWTECHYLETDLFIVRMEYATLFPSLKYHPFTTFHHIYMQVTKKPSLHLLNLSTRWHD